ncbi:MAG: hypothetical protein K9M45_09000, partial [Kiritimatiellales bacterium]|nr:hypothetical protein [Kiritimatiellales bacterium]
KNATRFRVDNGRQKKSSDDITMVKRNRDGSLDWNHAEYGRVLEIKDDSILVRRAMFGCKALAFKAGQTYAAPHVMSGPWGATRNMVWYYNLSTECPRDPKGRNCVDVLVDELAENFASGGRWETFDGVQFDAMTGEPHTGYHPSRINKEWPPDCNGDGKADGGMIGGMQTYGLGCFDFIKRLRTVVGPEKILAADGRRSDSQKSGDLSLNGIELEGFPEQDPYGFVAWSGAYNLLNQWKPATREPRFNYAALRYNGCEKFKQADLFRYYRLGVAGTCFTDSFLMANSWTSREIPPRLNEIFSGLEGRPVGWLGRPLGEAVHLAAQSRDEFKGRGKPFSPSAFRKRGKDDPWIEAGVKSFGGQFTSNKEKHLLVSPGEGEEVAAFTIKNVPYGTNEVFIELRLRSVATPKGYPEGYMRWMQANGSDQPKRYKIQYGYCGPEWTTHRYYFHNTRDLLTNESIAYNPEGQKHIDIEFRIWGPGAATEIEYITIHDAPEVVCRQFERGLVVANLSNQPIQLDRAVDTRFSKGWKLTVPAQDAVFQTLEK